MKGLSENEVKYLNARFPDEMIDMNRGFSYVPGEYVISRLNEVFNYNWDCRQVYVAEGTPTQDKKGNEVTPIYVGVELTVRSETGAEITRLGFGGSVSGYGKSAGDAHKGAYTDALKKAAQSLGVGLYLAIEGRAKRKSSRGRNYGGGSSVPAPPGAPSSGGNQGAAIPPPPNIG